MMPTVDRPADRRRDGDAERSTQPPSRFSARTQRRTVNVSTRDSDRHRGGNQVSTVTTQFVDVPGGRLAYQVRGSGPLLLVIGQPMTKEAFGPLADELA